jgi:hypothetical protein
MDLDAFTIATFCAIDEALPTMLEARLVVKRNLRIGFLIRPTHCIPASMLSSSARTGLRHWIRPCGSQLPRVGHPQGDTVIWAWIGDHNEYEKRILVAAALPTQRPDQAREGRDV